MNKNAVCILFFAIAYGVAFLPIDEHIQIVIIGVLFVSFCTYAVVCSYRKWRVERREKMMSEMYEKLKTKIKESGDERT